jgi:hypothetical protein
MLGGAACRAVWRRHSVIEDNHEWDTADNPLFSRKFAVKSTGQAKT